VIETKDVGKYGKVHWTRNDVTVREWLPNLEVRVKRWFIREMSTWYA